MVSFKILPEDLVDKFYNKMRWNKIHEDEDEDVFLAHGEWIIPLVFTWVIFFSSLIILTIMYFSTRHVNLSDDVNVLGYMQQNLKAYPILFVGQVNSSEECPAGFEQIGLFNWPGLLNTCVCKDSS